TSVSHRPCLFPDPPPTETYTLSLHDALPISTQEYLHQHLANLGFAGDGRLALMYGGMPLDQREKIKQAFQAGPSESGAEVRILRSEEHTSELQSRENLVCRLLLEKKKQKN